MIHSDAQPVPFLTQFTNGEQIGSSDTMADKGGGGRGFRPHELLEAALATCMNISLRMSAQKHGIAIAGVSVEVSLNREAPEGPTFVYRVALRGSLSDAQRSQLLSSVEHCPVRATLSMAPRFRAAVD
jgi:putative redox protein